MTALNQNVPSRLFLCGSPSQLLFALIDVCQTGEVTEILYFDDLHPLDTTLAQRLKTTFPEICLTSTNDAASEAEFANLSRLWPPIIRRNIRREGMRFVSPMHWTKGPLGSRRFKVGYTFHTGPFLAKVLAGSAAEVVLREDGLSNYYQRPMPGLKKFLRWVHGYRTATQTLGDEHWVHRIEISRPEALPHPTKQKASHFDALEQADSLPHEARKRIVQVFKPTDPEPADPAQAAVLLTQPLEVIGMGSKRQKISLYQELANLLAGRGYTVFIKNHPREEPYTLQGATSLDSKLPIELWTLASKQPFQLGVALCSAGLIAGSNGFCRNNVQLVEPINFVPSEFTRWRDEIPARLTKALSECAA